MRKDITMRRVIARQALTLLVAMMAMGAQTAWAQFGGGDGTALNPYIITTTDHMTELANDVNGGNGYRNTYFRLDADLDYTGKAYTIIADFDVNRNTYFEGYFNGNDHVISGVSLIRTSNAYNSIYIGLFGTICFDAVIERLTLSASTIKGRIGVGGIVGWIKDFYSSDPNKCPIIRNCHVTSDVTIETINMSGQNSGSVGGIVGIAESDRSTIIGCTSAATITASSYSWDVGGIVGLTQGGGSVTGCVCTGSISGGTSYVGGIVGLLHSDVTLADNYVGGACSVGAVGVEGSVQGTDEGYSVTHLYTASINYAQVKYGRIVTTPTMTISDTGYYTAGTVITLSDLYTFGVPAGGGMMWNYRAEMSSGDYVDVLPQEDGSWTFTMPASNVSVNPSGAKDITLTDYPYTTKVTLMPASAAFTGSGQKPKVSIVCRSRDLTEGTDFITDIPTAGYTAPGDYTFHVWGIGDYGGLRTETFTITRAALTQLVLSETSAYHDGAAHKPSLTVKSGNKTLNPESDYLTDLPEEGFTYLGEYTITVTGIGNYAGELTATYTIRHPWSGMGTQQNPFLVQSTADMNLLAQFVNGGKDYSGVCFRQMADIDYTGKTFTPVGKTNAPFNGTFDGGSFSFLGISYLKDNEQNVGLFGYVGTEGTLRSVTLTGTNQFRGAGGVGAIAGKNEGMLETCAIAQGANVTVTATQTYGGGIVGDNNGMVNSCYNNSATVTGEKVGGLVGLNGANGYVVGDNHATVNGFYAAGGICADNKGTVTGVNYGAVTGASQALGGIVALNSANVEYCLNVNDLSSAISSAATAKGAIIGSNQGGTVTNNYYIGECTYKGIGDADVKGLAMRGWPISHDERISFMPIPNDDDQLIGTYYDDGISNNYYAGEDETVRFVLYGGVSYSANDVTLAVAGHDDYYEEDYYELVMPAALVHIAPVGLTMDLYDNDRNTVSNAYYIGENERQMFDVTLRGRTLYKDGKWNTLCLPFHIALEDSPLKGAIARPLASASISSTALSLTFGDAVTTLTAGTPYIIKWSEDTEHPTIYEPTFKDVTIDATDRGYDNEASGDGRVRFTGTYSYMPFGIGDDSILLMGGANKLYYPAANASLGACRAYFKIGEDNEQPARKLTSFNICFSGESTGIVSLFNEQGRSAVESEEWYTLDGRRLFGKPNQPGLYFNNGKKMVIK